MRWKLFSPQAQARAPPNTNKSFIANSFTIARAGAIPQRLGLDMRCCETPDLNPMKAQQTQTRRKRGDDE